MSDDNVRPFRPRHPDDVPPTDDELADADELIAAVLDLGLAAFIGDGTDRVKLTWLGLGVAATLGAMVDVLADEMIDAGIRDALLITRHDTASRAMTIRQLLDGNDRVIEDHRRRFLAAQDDDDG